MSVKNLLSFRKLKQLPSIIDKSISKLFSHNNIFNFSKINFWNKFLSILFITTVWLFFVSIIEYNLINLIIQPSKIASHSTAIVEIYPENTLEKTEDKYKILTSYINKQSSIKAYHRVSNDEIKHMFTQFNITNISDVGIILPIVVKVDFYDNNNLSKNINSFRVNIQKKIKNIKLDTESEVINNIITPIKGLKIFALLMPIITLIALTAIVLLVLYSILESYKKTIEIVLFLGLPKKKLIYEFVDWIFKKALYAGFFGFILIIITAMALSTIVNNTLVTSAMYGYMLLTPIFIVIIPIIYGVICFYFIQQVINNKF